MIAVYIPVIWIPADLQGRRECGREYGILTANPCRYDVALFSLMNLLKHLGFLVTNSITLSLHPSL
jgi:hypothetical protein